MKKVILTIAAMALLTATAATASEKSKYIGLGYSTANILNKDVDVLSLNFGVDVITDSNILVGLDAIIDQASFTNDLEEETGVNSLISNFKLGYSLKGFSLYGLAGVKVQLFDDETGFGGFGTGIGVQYKIHDNFSIAVESSTFKLKRSEAGYDIEYDNKTTGIILKYCY